jgi:hypothetical protein
MEDITEEQLNILMDIDAMSISRKDFTNIGDKPIRQRLFNRFLEKYTFKQIAKEWKMSEKDLGNLRFNLYKQLSDTEITEKYINVKKSYITGKTKGRPRKYKQEKQNNHIKPELNVKENIEPQTIELQIDLNKPSKFTFVREMCGNEIQNFIQNILVLLNHDNRIEIELSINKKSHNRFSHNIEVKDTFDIKEFSDEIINEISSLPAESFYSVIFIATEIKSNKTAIEAEIEAH